MTDIMERTGVNPFLKSAASALRGTWAQSTDTSELRWRYRQAAALLDFFNPEQLRPVGVNAGPGSAYRDYAQDAERVLGRREKNIWRLNAELRRAALKRMGSREQMQIALQVNPERPETSVQRMLEAIVNANLPDDFAKLSRDDLQGLLTAIRWLEGILPPEHLPDQQAVADAFARADVLAPFSYLLAEGFVNRKKELKSLQEFLWSDEAGHLPFLLYGIGGVGKSALLSKFVFDEISDSSHRVLIVPLDVDRPNIDVERPYTYLLEAARQIGRQERKLRQITDDAAEAISKLGLRTGEAATGEARYSEADTQPAMEQIIKRFSELIEDAANVCRSDRVLITVDTFEEAQIRGDEVVAIVLEQFGNLMRRSPRLRVVLSGRIKADEDVRSYIDWDKAPRLYLHALDAQNAVRLLRMQLDSLEPPLARRDFLDLVRAVGRNPMCLKLAARLVTSRGREALTDPEARRVLLEDVREAKIQTFLFGRILDHFHTQDIKPLAYPGLIVRRITPDLIREVLSEPCGLKDADATILYEHLAREKSIVEPDGEGGLRYRTDLRQQLLPDVLNRVDNSVIEDIDRRAIAFYTGRDTYIDRAEELYHRLRVGSPDEQLNQLWEPALAPYLKAAVYELEGASQLWLAQRLRMTLKSDIRARADQASWERQTRLAVERFLRVGDALNALNLLGQRTERLPGSELYRLEVEALRMRDDPQAALGVARRGLHDARPRAQVELLLLIAVIQEGESKFETALDAVEKASFIASRENDKILYLRSLVTQIRLLRKLGRQKERDMCRNEALFLIDQRLLETLYSYPRLLEELAAELSTRHSQILGRAVKRLGLHSKNQTQQRALERGLNTLRERMPKRARSDVTDYWRDMQSVNRQGGAGLAGSVSDALERGADHEVIKSFSEFFRAGVDSSIGKKSDS